MERINTFHENSKKDRRACAAKASALKRLLGRGMPLEGSLNMSMRGGSEHWQLTDKVDGKSRTLYVPAGTRQRSRSQSSCGSGCGRG